MAEEIGEPINTNLYSSYILNDRDVIYSIKGVVDNIVITLYGDELLLDLAW